MATGGGQHSPAKLMPWEETASTFIDPGSHYEVGGTDEEDASQEPSARTSTSRHRPRATATTTPQPDKQARPTGSVPDWVESQQTTPAASVAHTHQDQQHTPTTDGGLSLPAPPTTADVVDANVAPEGVTVVSTIPTPTPLPTHPPHMEAYSSDDPCLHDSDLRDLGVCPFEEDSTQDAGPVNAPSTTPATTTPATTTPATTTPAPTKTLEARLSRVEARQESMLDLLRQYIADGEDTRRAIATAIAGTTTAIGETTAAIAANTAAVNASAVLMRDCLEAITQVLTSILLHIQWPRLGAGVEPASDTSTATTPASSVPASPVWMTEGVHGTDEEDASQEPSARTSTSRHRPRATATTIPQPDKQARPTGSVPDWVESQQTTPAASVAHTHQDQQHTPTTDGGLSLPAPPTTADVVDANVAPEGVTVVSTIPTPTPLPTHPPHMEAYSSDDPCLHDSDLRDLGVCHFEEDSTQDAGPVNAPSTTPATTTPATTTPATTTPAPTKTLEARLSRVEARQESMLDLLRQYIADGEDTRRAIATAIAGTTTAIGETTAAIAANTAAVNASAVLMRDCLEAVTQVLTSILLHIQWPRLGAGVEPASDTSTATTPASSVPASPVWMTGGVHGTR
ncbi:uncharacterized protein [Ambystoma mexicanum]|uniref:uncharacterized protein n=1 Tax=Ambystoma mexicanum TaxID=8296 RepID=UPI0037E7F28A